MVIKNSLFVVLLALLSSNAAASSLSLNISGQFDDLSGLGGVQFGEYTSFTMSAVFDSALDTNSNENLGVFDAVVTVNIDGYGEYVIVPGTFDLRLTVFGCGSCDRTLGYLLAYRSGLSFFNFGAEYGNPPANYDADSPTPVFLSSFHSGTANYQSGVFVPFSLVGTDDALLVNPLFFSLGGPMEITSVPVPPAMILFVSGLLTIIRRRHSNTR